MKLSQNGWKYIKKHVIIFQDFCKKLTCVWVQVARSEVCIASKNKNVRKWPKAQTQLAGTHPTRIRIKLDASEALDWSGRPKNKIQRPIMQEKWTGSEPTRSTGLYKRYRIRIHSFLPSSLSLLRPFSSQTLTLASQIYPEIAYAWLNQFVLSI